MPVSVSSPGRNATAMRHPRRKVLAAVVSLGLCVAVTVGLQQAPSASAADQPTVDVYRFSAAYTGANDGVPISDHYFANNPTTPAGYTAEPAGVPAFRLRSGPADEYRPITRCFTNRSPSFTQHGYTINA